MSFVIIRILGNDLPPRHSSTQTVDNLRFILAHELRDPLISKVWILNRIVDAEVEAELAAMITEAGHEYLRIPFSREEYWRLRPNFSHLTNAEKEMFIAGSLPSDYSTVLAWDHALHDKNLYVMNVNGARNLALSYGKNQACWTMVWDSNCFLPADGWAAIKSAASISDQYLYIIVPMHRVASNTELLSGQVPPPAEEEPQIVFRRDSTELFDDTLRYGRFSKVELLRRLGVPGVWDGWDYRPWEARTWKRSPESDAWKTAGWVARLASGAPDLDENPGLPGIRLRSNARRRGTSSLLKRLDVEAIAAQLEFSRLRFFNETALDSLNPLAQPNYQLSAIGHELAVAAGARLPPRIRSVTEKTTSPPSGSPHDYFSPAPFWWPNPESADGLPYRRRDGVRVPEAVFGSPQSDRFDCTRFQQCLDDLTILALASKCFGEGDFAAAGCAMARTWFLSPATRMNPHLDYAQWRPDRGRTGFGIIEAKDLYYALDALTILSTCTPWTSRDNSELAAWLDQYLKWLLTSSSGCAERQARNNHGTAYDLQVLALATFLRRPIVVADTIQRAMIRLNTQFSSDGEQCYETSRSRPLHYCIFNLQCWFNLASIAEMLGIDLWNYPSPDHAILQKAFIWIEKQAAILASQSGECLNSERWLPLRLVARLHIGAQIKTLEDASPSLASVQILHPYNGVAPFWALSLPYATIADLPRQC